MGEFLAILAVVAASAVLVWGLHRFRMRRAIESRLFEGRARAEELAALPTGFRWTGPRWRLFFSALVGAAGGLVVFHFIGWGVPFALAFGVLFCISSLLLLSFFTGMTAIKEQTQLADAIDLMVGSLQAGAGLLDALQSAEMETTAPLKRHLEVLLVRIRIGESPVDACRTLARRAEEESFRLFYSTLATQWESGGSVAPVLSDVGRFVRDHLETLRRVRGQMAEVRLSVLGVLTLTYLLGLVIWKAYPDRLEGFLTTDLGQGLASIALSLQALGAYWIYRLSKIRY